MVTDIADAAVAAEDWVSNGEAAIDSAVVVVDFVVGLGRDSDSGPVLFVVMVVAVAVEMLGIVVMTETILVVAVVNNRLVVVVVSVAAAVAVYVGCGDNTDRTTRVGRNTVRGNNRILKFPN